MLVSMNLLDHLLNRNKMLKVLERYRLSWIFGCDFQTIVACLLSYKTILKMKRGRDFSFNAQVNLHLGEKAFGEVLFAGANPPSNLIEKRE